MSEPTDFTVMAVELVGDAALDAHRRVGQALERVRLRDRYTISDLPGGRVMARSEIVTPGQLLRAMDEFALLTDFDGVRAKIAFDLEDWDGNRLRLMLDSRILDDTVPTLPNGGVAALVSEAFVDAYRNRPGASELSDYRRVLVDAPTELWAWLRTIPRVAEASSAITSLAVAPDGRHVVTGHRDGTVRWWDAATGAQVGEPFTGHGSEVRAVTVAAGVAQIISGDADGIIRRWSMTFGESIDVHTSSRGNAVSALVTTVDGRSLVVGFQNGDLRAWRLGSGRRDQGAFTIGTGAVTGLAATPNGERIVSSDEDGVIHWWNAATGEFLERREIGESPITALAVSPDGQHLVAGCEDGVVRIWHLRTKTITTGERGMAHVRSVAVTPDSRHLVSAHGTPTIGRRSLDSGQWEGQLSNPWGDVVHVVAVSPDGRQVFAGGRDGVLRRWEGGVPVTGTVPRERLADVVSDLETAQDALGISGDVHTIAAVLASLTTTPPLSVALLGDWGAGKSSFMRQLQARMEFLARGSPGTFAANLRQVTFNAWHYSDDHLWVGLIEHLFRELATPVEPVSDKVDELKGRLERDEAERQRLDHDLQAVERRGWLAPLRSALVFRAALRGPRLWLALGLALVGIVGVVVAWRFGQGLLAWIAGLVTLFAPVTALSRYTEKAHAQLVARKASLDDDIRATKEELDEHDPSRRLHRLLDEIGAADRYASFRGLTGRIHHDLRRLSDDLAAARGRWDGTGTPPLQRIVLYVDDLDRCTPERVVDVLQAVNLLLTMDLFMVVVAVDPQWLLGALRAHHGPLFTEPGREAGPVAYLDKIFHIPFALRPMGEHAAGLLRSLLPPEHDPEPVTSPKPPTRPEPVSKAALPAPLPESTPVPAMPTEAPASVSAEGLRVTAGEREFLARLTPMLKTPRAVKKLANLYRLLRLSVPPTAMDDFLDGPYQAAALLLAALTGAPHEARGLLTNLDPSTEDIVDDLRTNETRVATRLVELILEIRKDIPVHGDTATYHRWATVVARYGFETYDLFTGFPAGAARPR